VNTREARVAESATSKRGFFHLKINEIMLTVSRKLTDSEGLFIRFKVMGEQI
jgi:hypothetical protein